MGTSADEEQVVSSLADTMIIIGAPFWTIKIYLKSSRCIMVKTTERHGEAPLKDDLLLGYTGGLFSLHVG